MRIVGKAFSFPAYFTVALGLGFQYTAQILSCLGFVHIFGHKKSSDSHFYGSLTNFWSNKQVLPGVSSKVIVPLCLCL